MGLEEYRLEHTDQWVRGNVGVFRCRTGDVLTTMVGMRGGKDTVRERAVEEDRNERVLVMSAAPSE